MRGGFKKRIRQDRQLPGTAVCLLCQAGGLRLRDERLPSRAQTGAVTHGVILQRVTRQQAKGLAQDSQHLTSGLFLLLCAAGQKQIQQILAADANQHVTAAVLRQKLSQRSGNLLLLCCLGAVSVVDDYSVLSVDVKHFTPVADAVADGLQIADGSQLRLLFNPANDKLSLKATSEYIERERMLATRLNLNATNRGDSLSVYLRSEDFYVGTFHMPQLSVMGGARSDRLRLSAGFNDTTARVSALLGLEALVGQSPQRGRSVDVRLLPSHISRKGTTWQIFARNIQIDTARIAVDRFLVMNRDQELLVDGVASRHRRDSVLLRLKNFDLAPFTQIVENMGYVIEGRTNGQAVVKSALGGTEITADIRMDSVEVNDIPAPPMRFTSMWDFKNDRARLTVTDREKRDTLIRGFYAPATVRYYAEARFPGIRMNLLDPMFKGVISDTRGVAEAALTLTGQRRAAQLSGAIRIRDFHTKVDYTQVGYDVSEALLTVENNRLRMQQVQVADQLGNRGIMDFDLNLQHLSNISYSLTMQPRRMLVLNTTENDNDLFYGRVFATGRATVAGDKGSVRMDIVATTDDDSAFFLPLSSKSNVARADFITFETPQQKADTLNILERKKLMFERKHKPQAIEGNSMDIDMTLNVRPNADFQLVIDPTVGTSSRGAARERSICISIPVRTSSRCTAIIRSPKEVISSRSRTSSTSVSSSRTGRRSSGRASRSTRGSISTPSTNSKPRCNRSSVRVSRRAAAT